MRIKYIHNLLDFLAIDITSYDLLFFFFDDVRFRSFRSISFTSTFETIIEKEIQERFVGVEH